jgi:hypothetical protein
MYMYIPIKMYLYIITHLYIYIHIYMYIYMYVPFVGGDDGEKDGRGVLIIEYLHIYTSNKCICIYL